MEVLLLAVMAAANIVCFLTGAKVGQKVSKGEEVPLPAVNPMEAYRKREQRKEAEKEQSRIEAILHNVDSYDGTSNGQKDVPG